MYADVQAFVLCLCVSVVSDTGHLYKRIYCHLKSTI